MPGHRLSKDERVRIESWWTAGWSVPAIAQALGRHRSTVWRELDRHKSVPANISVYHASQTIEMSDKPREAYRKKPAITRACPPSLHSG